MFERKYPTILVLASVLIAGSVLQAHADASSRDVPAPDRRPSSLDCRQDPGRCAPDQVVARGAGTATTAAPVAARKCPKFAPILYRGSSYCIKRR